MKHIVIPLTMAGYKALSPRVGFHAGEWPLWLGTQPAAERKRLGNNPGTLG